jgi:RimJ/RimL family protein N-acetyltransferase
MAKTQLIPREDRQQQNALIIEISQAVFGSTEDAEFIEEFVPFSGRVPEPKAQNYSRFLSSSPTYLWAIYSDDIQEEIAGFILIMPDNEIGFGLKKSLSNQGVMSKAWEEIIKHPFLTLPIKARTSKRNHKAIGFLEKCGFKIIGETNFMGEDSWKMEMNLSN